MMAKQSWLSSKLNSALGVGGIRPALDVKISGDAQAFELLRTLPDEIALKVMRAALKKALQPAISAARRATARIMKPNKQGQHLFETVIDKIKTYKGNQIVYGMVGVTAPHSWLVEHGHRLVKGGSVRRVNTLRKDYGRADRTVQAENKGRGRVVGQVPPHPYLAPAEKQAMPQVQAIFVEEVEKGVARAVKRMAKLEAKA
jgi:HK97 gp10 family phage protein